MKEKKMRLVTISEVKEILVRETTERDEPINEQRYAREHSDRFGRISSEDSSKLIEELMENVPRMKEHHAYKLADFLPEHPEDVKIIFARERFSLTVEEIQQILDIAKNYLPGE